MLGVNVKVCVPLGAYPSQIALMTQTYFNVLLDPETGESATRRLEKARAQPYT